MSNKNKNKSYSVEVHPKPEYFVDGHGDVHTYYKTLEENISKGIKELYPIDDFEKKYGLSVDNLQKKIYKNE